MIVNGVQVDGRAGREFNIAMDTVAIALNGNGPSAEQASYAFEEEVNHAMDYLEEHAPNMLMNMMLNASRRKHAKGT